LLLTDYAGLQTLCERWARGEKPIALDFANTQIVTMRRHDASFRELTADYDFFPPDGMPLVWCLNRAGAQLKDRVYGPTFMRKFLESVPATSRHYLLGGSEECGNRIRDIFTKRNPGLKFVGSFHGRCLHDGALEGEAELKVIDEINRLAPDYIWVGFGTPKQHAWLKRHKHLIQRGVILTVGFAFDVNAGMKPDAPAWMQRLGLTWVFRLCSEPRRLLTRYARYNSLFLWYVLTDSLKGRAWGR
jgi:N-acetylglucosaminyldiphosphoundecaprenol N-acetyl-beta-D-mannosaminyltransferase